MLLGTFLSIFTAFVLLGWPLPIKCCSQTQKQVLIFPCLCLLTHTSYPCGVWSLSCHAGPELVCPLNVNHTLPPFSVFWFSPRQEHVFCWHIKFQHSLFSLVSGNVLTLLDGKNYSFRVCDCSPTEVPQVRLLFLQFCLWQNSLIISVPCPV